jgi:hypothetical protein
MGKQQMEWREGFTRALAKYDHDGGEADERHRQRSYGIKVS